MKSRPKNEALIKECVDYVMSNWEEKFDMKTYTDGTGCFTLMFHSQEGEFNYQMVIYGDARKEKIVKAIEKLKERISKDDFPHIGESTYAKTIIKQ